jgi:heat-inducible transcriptional repressor
MKLDERKRKILESIIKDYVETAEPVGSRAVVKKHELKISAATVRNEMADLEDMGYLEQPHTSAGRIPSEKGFRYYVDYMMEKEILSEQEIELLQKLITESLQDWGDVVQGIGQFISQVTNYTSFVIVPSVKFSSFQYLHLVPVQTGQAMVILVTDAGLIMHRKIDIPHSVTNHDLQLIGELFNRGFRGKKLSNLKRTDLQIIRDELKRRREVIDKALGAIEGLLDNSGDEKVVVSGALNMLKEPEFKDLDKLRRILTLFEEVDLLKGVIPNQMSEEVGIRIGTENEVDDIKEMSIVFAGYKASGEMGKIGLFGPVRMEYWKAAGTVESVRNILDNLLKEHFFK